MQQSLKERIFPNLSIKLRPPSPNACDKFNCYCKMCKVYQKNKLMYLLKTQQDQYRHKFSNNLKDNANTLAVNLQWVLNRLMIPIHKMIIRPIQIYIPEVLFYKDGQPQALYMNRQISVRFFLNQDYRIKKIKKQKINQTYLQKIFNERRRKYRDQVMILMGQKVIDKKQSIFAKKQQRIDTKDAAVVQYIDGSEQLITQNQLINLMLKRKQDPIWKKIESIKNFVTTKEVSKRLIKLTYDHTQYKAKILMKIYGGNIIKSQKEYITQQNQIKFTKQLLKRSMEVYGQYVLYQIINFIDYFYDEKITHITCAILVNQFQRPYLVDVFKLQTVTLVKYKWTNQTYMKKIVEEENKIFFNDKEIQINPQIQEKSKILQKSMIDKYELQKDKYGLTQQDDDLSEEKANDKFFSFLHPQFKQELSSVLKDPYLTISDFKKHYLGQVNQRKSIIKPYTSNFIKNLHRMTPKLKVTTPHRLQYSPLGQTTSRNRRTLSQLSKTFTNSARQTIDAYY